MYKGDIWQHYECIEITAKTMLKNDKKAYMVDIDDLLASGINTLMKCARSYDNRYKCTFRQYLIEGLKLQFLNDIRKYKNREKYHFSADSEESQTKVVHAIHSHVSLISVEREVISKLMVEYMEHELMRAFKFVVEEYRDVWVAYYYEELTIGEIAKMTHYTKQYIQQIIKLVSNKLAYIFENRKDFVY